METEKTESEKKGGERYSIHAVEKALDVIEALSEHDSLSLIELVDLVKQPKSSLYRIILTMENRGFITRSEMDGKYCLGLKQLALTSKMLERNSLRNVAWSRMNRLVQDYGDTVNLCVITEDEVLYVEIIEGTYALRMSDRVGSRAPFHATATGKAIAAHLPEERVREMIKSKGLQAYTPHTIVDEVALFTELQRIRDQGYAVDNQEIVLGARCIAAPIFNMFNRVEGSISLSGALHRFPEDQLSTMAEGILTVADEITEGLGGKRKSDS